MDYLEWNDLIAAHFFREENADKRVYLYVNKEIIEDIGQPCDFQDFINAVKLGPWWVTIHKKCICKKAWQSLEKLPVNSELKYPPYIAYLALFVLAASMEKQEDSPRGHYYRRLRILLDEGDSKTQYPDFEQMGKLWENLEKWSTEDKDGELGIFKRVFLSGYKHVALPISQAILNEDERKNLPNIFALAELDPTVAPSEGEIAKMLQKHGSRNLQKRYDSQELREALIERIYDEFYNWDGTAELSDENRSKKVFGSLRLCCKLDRIAQQVKMTLRCTTKHEFPEDDLCLVRDDNSETFSCHEEINNWSSPLESDLESESSETNLNGSEIDWGEGLQMQDAEGKWRFKLPASFVRVFVEGKSMGLSGLVEVGKLPQGSSFYLAVHQDCCQAIEEWGNSSCQGWKELSITKGLPQDWRFFEADFARSDKLVRDPFPMLAFPTNFRLEFEGGIRLGKGNSFFSFTPPKLLVQGGDESLELYCNDRLLNADRSTGFYQLPPDVPIETKLAIEARQGEELIKRKTLTLLENFTLGNRTFQQFDRFGEPQQNLGVAGALLEGFNPPDFNFNTFLPVQGEQRVFFVGKQPGQIIKWPEEQLPTDWSPVWGISLGRRRGQTMFCGTSIEESKPNLMKSSSKKKVKEWKEKLWNLRKRISPPSDPRLKALWQQYQQEAKNA